MYGDRTPHELCTTRAERGSSCEVSYGGGVRERPMKLSDGRVCFDEPAECKSLRKNLGSFDTALESDA